MIGLYIVLLLGTAPAEPGSPVPAEVRLFPAVVIAPEAPETTAPEADESVPAPDLPAQVALREAEVLREPSPAKEP